MYIIPECASQPCLNNGTCIDVAVNNTRTFQCECDIGFTADTCEVDVDDCDSSPCYIDGLFIYGVNSFSCNCSEGFIGHCCYLTVPLSPV